MNKIINKIVLIGIILSVITYTEIKAQQTQVDKGGEKIHIHYSSSGSASININKPLDFTFKTFTNINLWPTINKGVTKSIQPKNTVTKVGSIFYETISSPIPGINDWTNEWIIEEFIPNKKLVISGLDHFTKVPIRTRLSYVFKKVNKTTTLFERKIEVTIDENFTKAASKQELEALYRYMGSQWEMAVHLKHFIENYKETY